jgi:hypothetical protein
MAPSKKQPLPLTVDDHPPGAADGGDGGSAPVVRPGKRSWQEPQVRTGHLFESNSLACGKNTPMLEQCNQNPLTS